MAFKMKGSPMQRNFGVGSKPGPPADLKEVTISAEKSANPKMNDKAWAAGNVKASSAKNNEGKTDLDGLVKRRSSQKKGSDEYKTTQNAINAALGNKTKHETKDNSRSAETQEKKAVVTKKAIEKRVNIVDKAEDKAKIDSDGDAKVDYRAQRKLVRSAQKESRKHARLDVKDARKEFGRGTDEHKAAKAAKKANNKANRTQRRQNRKDDKENKEANRPTAVSKNPVTRTSKPRKKTVVGVPIMSDGKPYKGKKGGAPFIGKILGVAKKVMGGIKKVKDVKDKVEGGVEKVKNMAGF